VVIIEETKPFKSIVLKAYQRRINSITGTATLEKETAFEAAIFR
jgi:hypothetical protein